MFHLYWCRSTTSLAPVQPASACPTREKYILFCLFTYERDCGSHWNTKPRGGHIGLTRRWIGLNASHLKYVVILICELCLLFGILFMWFAAIEHVDIEFIVWSIERSKEFWMFDDILKNNTDWFTHFLGSRNRFLFYEIWVRCFELKSRKHCRGKYNVIFWLSIDQVKVNLIRGV